MTTATHCTHTLTDLRRRVYADGSRAAVKQCLHCGRHVAAVPLTTLGVALDTLPAYDEELQTKKRGAVAGQRELFGGLADGPGIA